MMASSAGISAAIEAGANTYSRYDGAEELRRALASKMKRDNGLEYAKARDEALHRFLDTLT